jgi:uncharacterized membrane protein YbhN (UPF0104 family)
LSTDQFPSEANQPEPRSGQRKNSRRSLWVLLFSLILASVLLYFTLRGLDWSAFWKTIRNGYYEFLMLVILIGSANYFIRALRWSIFIRSEKKIPILSVFWANMVGHIGNV